MALTQTVEIFFSYSYSQEDEELREKLAAHLSTLKREGLISAWYDREISAGTVRDDEILKHLNSAHIILLLISVDFIESDYCYGVELKRAMERHEAGEARVIPVLIRECDWEIALFRHLQPLPRNRSFINNCSNLDSAFTEIAKEIRKVVTEVASRQQLPKDIIPSQEPQQPPPKSNFLEVIKARLSDGRMFWFALLISILSTSLIIGIRRIGVLQAPELYAYDQLMKFYMFFGKEESDERLLIVNIKNEDLASFKEESKEKKNERGAELLSDSTLTALLNELKHYGPALIGLDFYHEFNASEELAPLLRKENVVAVCKTRSVKDKKDGIEKPPEVEGENRFGFSNTIVDPGNIVRRQLLQQAKDVPFCTTENSFNLVLAAKFLKSLKSQDKFPYESESAYVEDLELLEKFAGGYQNDEDADNSRQVLLKYRATHPPEEVAETISLAELLKDDKKTDEKDMRSMIQGKIVLIGFDVDTAVGDTYTTPFYQGDNKRISGVVLQAHMISQLIRFVLDGRPLIGWWSIEYESLWIWFWALIGGVAAWRLKSVLQLIVTVIILITVLSLICCIVFLKQSYWIPLVPPAITVLTTATGVRLLKTRAGVKPQLPETLNNP